MKTRLLSVLLLSATFPLAAVAQDTGTNPDDGATGTSQTQPVDGTNSTTGTNDNSGASSTEQDATTPSTTPSSSSDGTSTMDDSSSTMDSGTSAMDSGNAVAPDQGTNTSMASGETFVTVPETGAWRVSDLEGKAVYGSDGANIGDINDVLVSQDGSVNAVIIGVGGFLGIGEKDVAVNMSALQLGPGDTQAQANAASSALPDPTGATGAVSGDAAPGQSVTGMDGSGATTTDATGDMAANTAGTGATIGDDGLPDRIILNVTREQLEQAPAFEGVEATQP